MKTQTNYYVEPVFQNIPWVNSEKLDFNKSLKNKKINGGNGIRKYILDVHQLSWAQPERVFREIQGGSIWDIYKEYTNINLLWNGDMKAYITKISNVWELPIPVKVGDIVDIKWRIHSTNGTFSISVDGGRYRLLYGDMLSLSKSHNEVGIVIIQDWYLNIKYADYQGKMITSLSITIT